LNTCETEIECLHKLGADYKVLGDERGKQFQIEPYAKSEEQDGLPILRKIEQIRDFSDVFKDLSRHPRLIEVVRSLLGDDLLLFCSTLMLKLANQGSAHSFHQDSAYWSLRPPSLVTVSIALTESTSENACIQVIPSSHEWGMQEWGYIARPYDQSLSNREDLDTSNVMEVPLKAGSALMFHSLVVHGSGPNRSPRLRYTALYAYFPPTVQYISKGGSAAERTIPVVSGLEGREELTLIAEAVA
jgi:ectoine hydroxylase-related dioxygenase (phytanoyl-CoA dioxygenase family)